MSSHSLKSKRRHPHPTTFERERFPVAHVVFQVIDHPENGVTFGLFTCDPDQSRPLFSSHIEKGMGTQLRKLAHRIDELEAKL